MLIQKIENRFWAIFKVGVHFRELIKGSITFFVFKLLGIIISYAFTVAVTRTFGAYVWGTFVLCSTVLQITSIVSKLGSDTAFLRLVAEYSSQKKWKLIKEVYFKILRIIIPFTFFITFLFFYFSSYISKNIFHKESLTFYLHMICVGVPPFVLLSITKEGIRGLKKIKEYAFLNNISIPFFAFLFFFVFIMFSQKNYIPILSYTISIYIGLSITLLIWLKNLKFIIQNSQELNCYIYKFSYKYLLSISIPMLLANSLFLVMQWADTIILGMLKTEREVGIYNITLKLATLTSINLTAINSIAAPKFAEFWGRNDIKGLEKIVKLSTKFIFFSSFPLLLTFFIFPSYILNIFGSEFKRGVISLVILTFGQFINAICGSVGYILNMTGKQNIVFSVILIATLINIILNFFLIPKFGINGAAFASLISIIFWNISFVIYIKIKYGFTTLPV